MLLCLSFLTCEQDWTRGQGKPVLVKGQSPLRSVWLQPLQEKGRRSLSTSSPPFKRRLTVRTWGRQHLHPVQLGTGIPVQLWH